MVDDAREWLTRQETMDLLGVGRTRLWQLTQQGRLVAHRRGANRKQRYYRRDDVERLAAEYQPVGSHMSDEPREGEGDAGGRVLPGE